MTDDTMVRHTGNAAGTPPAPDGGNSAGAPPAPDAQRRAARGAFARVGFACLLLLVSAFLVQSLLLALFPESMRVLLANSWGYYAFAMLSQYAVGLPLFWLLLRPLPRQTWPDGRLSAHSWWEFLLMCFGLGFGGNLIGRFVTLLASLLLGVNAVNPLETLLTGTALAPQFVYVGLLAPVIEELLFRKLLIDRLHRFGDRAAILVSAVAFGCCTAISASSFTPVSSGCCSAMSIAARAACATPSCCTWQSTSWAVSCRRRCCPPSSQPAFTPSACSLPISWGSSCSSTG